jgi:hypothetical protein
LKLFRRLPARIDLRLRKIHSNVEVICRSKTLIAMRGLLLRLGNAMCCVFN